jgi:transposase
MYYTGIDLHKFTSFLTTVESDGKVVKKDNFKNVPQNFIQYFSSVPGQHIVTVESTMSWYWLNDLLDSINIPMVLAHAKYVKAIAYAKVKTDKGCFFRLKTDPLFRLKIDPPLSQRLTGVKGNN